MNGESAESLFRWLVGQVPDPAGEAKVDWNFTKFLIGRDGTTTKRFEPKESPLTLRPQIEAALNA